MTGAKFDGWGLPVPEPLTETPAGKLRAGDEIHFRISTTAWGDVHARGSAVTLTPELIGRTLDQLGRSWLDSVDDEGARIGRGPWPDGVPSWRYGDPTWQQARERASRAAWSHLDPAVRAQALREVEQLYGPAQTTSKTINGAEDPSVRAAAEQDRLLRAGGVRLKSSYHPGERP